MAHGIFGSIGCGAMFDNMTVVSGRVRHDARKVSDRVLRANRVHLRNSEVISGVLYHAVEHRRVVRWAMVRAAWGSVSEWAALGSDDSLQLSWPRRLVMPTPR